MRRSIEEDLARAADPGRPTAERAEAAHRAYVGKKAERAAFHVDAAVVGVIASRWSADEALAVALSNEGSDRRAALERAVALRQAEGPGDVPLSRALLELDRVPEALDSMVDELAALAGTDDLGPAVLGAWGQHLVEVFGKLDESRYRDFVFAIKDRDDASARLVVDALAEAPVTGAEVTVRDRLLYQYEKNAVRWLIERQGS